MKIALVMNLAPRKLGSLEDWVVAFCREASWEGHEVHAYGRGPVHPVFAARLSAFGVSWRPVEQLERGWSSARLLAGYDVVHLNLCAPRGKIALAAYAAAPAKVLFNVHSEYPKQPTGWGPRALSRRVLDRLSLIRVHSLGGVSDHVREQERRRFGLPVERTRVLHNGVDFTRFKPRAELVRREGLRIITAAYFQPDKGVHHLIRAFARVQDPTARLTICGDGPEAARLERLIAELNLGDRVELIGLRSDLEELLPKADLFIHTARREAFGLAIAEAMACGLAVIASRVGGVPELVEDGISGLLVPPGDEPALTCSIERVLGDPALRLRLGASARSRIVEQFGLRRSALEHLLWCQEAANQTLTSPRPVPVEAFGWPGLADLPDPNSEASRNPPEASAPQILTETHTPQG